MELPLRDALAKIASGEIRDGNADTACAFRNWNRSGERDALCSELK